MVKGARFFCSGKNLYRSTTVQVRASLGFEQYQPILRGSHDDTVPANRRSPGSSTPCFSTVTSRGAKGCFGQERSCCFLLSRHTGGFLCRGMAG